MSGDDLANVWGTNLVNMTKSDEREFGGYSKELEYDEFKRIISNHFSKEFLLHKICLDGSSANLLAIIDATFGNTSCCYIAAGSYLSAADAVLQNLSTSDFYMNSSFSIIRIPDLYDTPFSRQQIVALPYHIEGTMLLADLEKYEDKCIRVLHEKCMIMRIKGSPMKCILLELMLAGNGAILSNRALEQLAFLSIKHDFKFIVDEIMTGGRTGTMLYLHKKPLLFVERVSHVTLGKWMQVGMVLISKQQSIRVESIKRPTNVVRSSSTQIDLSTVIPIWNKVVYQLKITEIRRKEAISKLKCKKEEVWGEGCLLFAPCKNNTLQNLKCRFLPRLERQKISSTNLKPSSNTVSKTYVNHLIVQAVTTWMTLQHYTDDDDKEFIPLIRHLSFKRMIDPNMVVHTDEICSEIRNFEHNRKKIGEMFRKLQIAGFLEYQIVGRKRLRSWSVLEDCSYQY